jgi:hypothetical protein
MVIRKWLVRSLDVRHNTQTTKLSYNRCEMHTACQTPGCLWDVISSSWSTRWWTIKSNWKRVWRRGRKKITFDYLPRLSVTRGRFFTFFSRIFPQNFLGKQFFETFSAENSNFPRHFLGEKFPRNFPRNFPRKKCTKHRPLGSACKINDLKVTFADAYRIDLEKETATA